MLTATLTRTLEAGENGNQGTFGELVIQGIGQSWVTGELPWRDNIPSLSRIDVGQYTCIPMPSAHFGRSVYNVIGTPGRSNVEIHMGNFCGDTTQGFKSDVLGCIIVGEELWEIDGQTAVLNSDEAFDRLMLQTNLQILQLTVKDAFP